MSATPGAFYRPAFEAQCLLWTLIEPIGLSSYASQLGLGPSELQRARLPQQAPNDALTRQLEQGTDGVKIFSDAIVGGDIGVLSIRLDIAKAVVTEAHERGKREGAGRSGEQHKPAS